MKKLKGRPLASVWHAISCSCRLWSVRSDARDPLFYPKAGRRAVGLEIGRADHDDLRFGPLGGQAFHHPSEHAHFVPPLPTVIQCLVRSTFPGRIPLSTRLSSTRALPWLLGKYGDSRAICSSVSQYRPLMLSLLAEPEHIALSQLISPESNFFKYRSIFCFNEI